MLNQEEIKALFEIFKSGSIENIELALQLAKNSSIDLSIPHFEELFEYLVNSKSITYKNDATIIEKIHVILNIDTIKIKVEEPDFSIVPGSIYLLKNLKKLSIGAKIDTYIPNTIEFFENLEELEIYLLNQEKIPLSIFKINSLKKLDLSLNLFEELPREIWQLRNLEEICLINCLNLSFIPNEIFGLPKLKNVFLLNTLVDEISPSIVYSPIEKYVVEFDSEGKQLMANPEIGKKMLSRLSSGTKWGIALKNSMSSGTFMRNKVKNVPDKIKAQGLNAIKEYFKEKK